MVSVGAGVLENQETCLSVFFHVSVVLFMRLRCFCRWGVSGVWQTAR